jgi:hypothetical protein
VHLLLQQQQTSSGSSESLITQTPHPAEAQANSKTRLKIRKLKCRWGLACRFITVSFYSMKKSTANRSAGELRTNANSNLGLILLVSSLTNEVTFSPTFQPGFLAIVSRFIDWVRLI